MPLLSLRMNDAPTKGTGAFAPTPYGATTPAASSQGVLRLEGYPVASIPSPPPAAMDDGELGGPLNQPSRVAPNVWRPSIYIPHISHTTTFIGQSRTSSNVAPVPVPWVSRSAAQTQLRVRVGGRTVTRWPRQFVRWFSYREVGKNA